MKMQNQSFLELENNAAEELETRLNRTFQAIAHVEPAVRQELSQYRQKLNERYNACHVRENGR